MKMAISPFTERDRLLALMDEIIKECDGPSKGSTTSIGDNALKLHLVAEFLRCAKPGERDIERLKQMAVDNVLSERGSAAA